MKLAAIDVGSNAVRLLLSRVFESTTGPFFKKEALVRIPIRLGEDAFVTGEIGEDKSAQLIQTMMAFKHLIQAYQASAFRACATSAMREAGNGWELAVQIQEETGIALEIIEGAQEAEIIYSNRFENSLEKAAYLYIDVGGGSTELSLIGNGERRLSRSFDIGTVRLLHNLVPTSSWDDLKGWLHEQIRPVEIEAAIGSGGNINKLFSLSGSRAGKSMTLKKLRKMAALLNQHSFEERIVSLGLRPDRADVILPACEIYTSVMKCAGIKKIYAPQIGLPDGMIHLLYERLQAAEATAQQAADGK